MAETFKHKDGEMICIEVERLQAELNVDRATVIWWMTQCSRLLFEALKEFKELAKDENHPDREHIAAVSAYYVKQRLIS